MKEAKVPEIEKPLNTCIDGERSEYCNDYGRILLTILRVICLHRRRQDLELTKEDGIRCGNVTSAASPASQHPKKQLKEEEEQQKEGKKWSDRVKGDEVQWNERRRETDERKRRNRTKRGRGARERRV